MIGIIIFAIAFFIASTGALGGDLIYAFDVLENWYYIIATIISLIALGVMLYGTAAGAAMGAGNGRGNIGGILGAAAGYSLSGLIAVLMLLKIGVQIWLVLWLMENIDPAITEFGQLDTKEMLAMAVVLVLAFIGGGKK